MFIHSFENVRFISGSAQVELPRPNLILDPRANFPNHVLFDCHYHDDGITVTLTSIDKSGYFSDGHEDSFSMRVYDLAHEAVPDFNSTIYTYLGHDKECPPADTTVAIINPPIKTIKKRAFLGCREMKRCIIYSGIETIEKEAFRGCISLDALFLPSSLKNIEPEAFSGCTNIRILPLPININISRIGSKIIFNCHTLFQITQIQQYQHRFGRLINNDQVHQALIDLYRNVPPLHRACLDVNVSVQAIHNCIVTHGTQAASIIDHDGMTPLHILAMNPYTTVSSIEECLNTNKSSSLLGDSRGNTPLDYLREHNLDGHTWVVTALCMHREAYSPSVSNNNDGDQASINKNKRKRIN